jgi:hypothetical protein
MPKAATAASEIALRYDMPFPFFNGPIVFIIEAGMLILMYINNDRRRFWGIAEVTGPTACSQTAEQLQALPETIRAFRAKMIDAKAEWS